MNTLHELASRFTGEAHISLDGWITIGAVIIGAFFAVLYLRGIYLVLHYASETYDVNLNGVDDREYSSRRERTLLYVGSALLVVLSALIISSYGFGWLFLYLGPAITLFGPLVIIISMAVDIRKYRSVLREQPAGKTAPQKSNAIPANQLPA